MGEKEAILEKSGGGANAYIFFVIYYRLTILLCLGSWLTKLKRLLFSFLWKGVFLTVLSLFVMQDFPQLVLLTELQSWIKYKPRNYV